MKKFAVIFLSLFALFCTSIQLKNHPDSLSRLALDQWVYIEVDSIRQSRNDLKAGWWFGLAMGDLTGDGKGDIVSGKYFYKNPGGDMSGQWERKTFPVETADATHIINVDDDTLGDVIAMDFPDVYWFEAEDRQGSSWKATKIGAIPPTGHGNTEGFALAQIVAGGKQEILFGGDKTSIYYFEIPANPEYEKWPRTLVTQKSNLSVGTGDIDNDGDIDIASGGKPGFLLNWFENPGDGSAHWKKHNLGDNGISWVDQVRVADMNGDGKADIITTQEGRPHRTNLATQWYEQPDDPKHPDWKRHVVVTQYSTNNLDVADMDGDGDYDIVNAEVCGTQKVAIWENDGKGIFTETVIDMGKESHDGARIIDLDNDGDLDIVSPAWTDYQYLHVWRNDSKNR